MEDMEAGSGFWSSGFCVGRRHARCRVSPLRRSVLRGLRFGKCICRAEPTLDLDDGLALPAQKPSQFDSESVGSFCSYGADAMFKGPLAI